MKHLTVTILNREELAVIEKASWGKYPIDVKSSAGRHYLWINASKQEMP